MSLLQRFFPFMKAPVLPNETAAASPTPGADREIGRRTTPENQMRYLYRSLWVDPEVRQAILDVREMDRLDGRVKRIHGRMAGDTVRGGLVFSQPTEDAAVGRIWREFAQRLQLNNPLKLRSDARALVMEGNLALQWVIDGQRNVVAAVRMPSETLLPNVDQNGRFADVAQAYRQIDVLTGTVLASFALYQLTLARFDPDSFDDMGALGRPLLDASRTCWRKLRMTEEDLVIRRRMRAPLRLAHVLEGAQKEDIDAYRADVERNLGEITTDYYLNRKGGVSPVQGDANLDQIGDVVHLMDTFFAGTPLPKSMLGYIDGIARDVLADLMQIYYYDIDQMQDTQSHAYNEGFRLQLLLNGINPDGVDYCLKFAERRTETPSQTTDRMLKWQALGLPPDMIQEELGLNPAEVKERQAAHADEYAPYPDGSDTGRSGDAGQPIVKITPGNERKGSGTSISNG